MFSKKRLEMDIRELDVVDPKYISQNEISGETTTILDSIKNLNGIVYLQPNDPWMIADDALIHLPYPPTGEGLSMKVCAFPIANALGGKFVWNSKTSMSELVKIESLADYLSEFPNLREMNLFSDPGLSSMDMILSDILIPLKMGILLLENGSVYIGERKTLAKLDPPKLDDQCRLILHPFRDEELFESDIITDDWGYKRQRFSQELAIRSLAFSKAAYTMHIAPFIMDGWLDYTLIYEGSILARADDWNREPSARKQFYSSIKQLIASQSTKAVVMGRPMSNNNAIINITFTGTKHTADWLNNLKVGVSNELHKGFFNLATQFDNMSDDIHLSLLARTMGRTDLTLTQVLQEAKSPGSKFKIWVTGHSQGGALTQVYIAEFLCKRGVLPENIYGYSFASPSVATSNYCKEPGNYPVYNINNADDFAVRVGSVLRLGIDLMYYPDEQFRLDNYPNYSTHEVHQMYQDILKLCYWMTDSFKFGEFMIAIVSFSTQYPVAKNFVEWVEETPLLNKLFKTLTKRSNIPKVLHDRMYKMLKKPYLDVGGKPPSEEHIEIITEYLKILFDKWGIDCFSTYTYATHQIPKNYSSIVQKPYSDFKRAVWTISNPSKLLTHDNISLMEEIPFPQIKSEI